MKQALFVLLPVAVLAYAEPAAAQPRPAVGDCDFMSEVYGPDRLWWGRFSGGRRISLSMRNDDFVDYRTAEQCFRARAACEDWLYAMRSKYQFMPRYSECGRGYAPGRPLRRRY